ncbi:chemotaxis protein [Yersinia sp. Marseille-Q3913]|uniref:chemotaxis protein n=1 Tax=Yersinia sp. Marseille-Q3913 TaxID=2830769 RepID=UPI001BAF6EA1|nr:chemotaxis protein [Yersinia sp. Marseille-Q3913]MBS0056525.1 chemotaxis protein [Yersinia sp. Marseille-Q3913]
MGISVSHGIKALEQNTPSVDGKSYRESNIDDVLSSLSDVIFKMFELFKKMRDLLSAYNQKQQELGWDLQVNSMNQKRESIADTYQASILSGSSALLSGSVGIAGGVASLSPLGELASHAGTGAGKISEGGFKIGEGGWTRDAELSRMTGDLQNSNSQSYAKSISALQNSLSESRQSSKELSKDVTNIINQIAMAVKL